MEIPFVVNARKDTGLNNSKVGIWLFLASEVTLFGGLFSGYLFLRIYADYPWPERTLPILPGLLNTFILIGSSITVVFAWAALKMRQWGKFQIYMGITLICALLFMVLKGFEYNAKFNHQAVRILDDGAVNDFAIIEGHTHYAILDHGEIHHAEKGDEGYFKQNRIAMKASKLTFALTRPVHDSYIAELLEQAGGEEKFKLTASYVVKDPETGEELVVLKEGAPLNTDNLDLAEDAFVDGKNHDAKIRTAFLKGDWDYARDKDGLDNQDAGWKVVMTDEWKTRQKESAKKLERHLIGAASTITYSVDPPLTFHFDPDAVVKHSATQVTLRDDTTIEGVFDVEGSSLPMAVDGIDFRFTAQRAVEEGIDPAVMIAGSWILENEDVKEVWDAHQEWLRWQTERLAQKSRNKGKEGVDAYVPTESEKYRVNWDQMVSYQRAEYKDIYEKAKNGELDKPNWIEGFVGPNHSNEEFLKAFPEIVVPRDKIGFESTFTPKWNTYYAIYFTITGLHGLHVIGGMIVLGYYLFFGRKMYESNPEWLANRVEVGGLFWHFVDLVWIFLFPILYLM
ncbi:MAG: cytochrome c oxidase subunit 3 [Akkermansiaceae bacterium]